MKKLISIILIFTLSFCLGGCYDSKEISRVAFVLAIGFDKNEYSFQLINPSAFSGDTSSSPLVTHTIAAEDIYTAMDILNTKISEKCDYSHIKMVIFSEDKLKRGIEREIDAMLKSTDFHPNTRISMCKGKASEYMKSQKIPLEANPSEFYENIFSSEFTEYSPDTKLKDMQKRYSTQITGKPIPIINSKEGMAILKEGVLKTTTDAKTALLYNLLVQKDFKCNFPADETTVVRISKNFCTYNVNIKQTPPLVCIKITIEGNIIWEENNKQKEQIANTVSQKLQSGIEDLMYKCSKEYKTDIFEFSKYASANYLTVQALEKENMQKLFENAVYKVNVNVKIN